jgi:transcriptional regulator with XRE-family HTH domain
MTKIRLLAQTDKTVTLRRADFQALLEAAEDNADLAAVVKHRAEEQRLGWDVAKRNYLTREETERLLDGESPVRVWREKSGIRQGALALAAGVRVGYLAEIEGGKKPGSTSALQSVAKILEIPMELLADDPVESAKPILLPITRSKGAAARLNKLAEKSGNLDHVAAEARTIVAEWLEIAERDGLRHQVKAAVGALEALILAMAKERAERANQLGDNTAAKKVRRVSDALEAAWDALGIEYDKL